MFSSVRVYLATTTTHFKRINKHTGTDIPWHMGANCDFLELIKKTKQKTDLNLTESLKDCSVGELKVCRSDWNVLAFGDLPLALLFLKQ